MKTLALLIDGDNAQLSATKDILPFCEVFGSLTIKNAYGDWKQAPLSSQCQLMTELGITLIQQNRVAKNATDFRLAMDVAVMLEKGLVDIYFIVSSDGHFTAVCDQINQKGAKVVGIAGNGNASSELRKVCDLFFDLDDVVKNPSPTSVNASFTLQSKTASNPITKSKAESKAESKISPTIEKHVEPPTKAATVPQLKTSAVLKLLSKPTTNAASAPKLKAAPKPKAEVQPKVQAKSKAITKPKVEARPETTQKSTAKAKVKVTSQPNIKLDEAAMLKILINIYKKAPQKDGWVHLAQLGDIRPQLKQKFGLGFANKPIATWFKIFEDKFDVEKDRVRMKYTA